MKKFILLFMLIVSIANAEIKVKVLKSLYASTLAGKVERFLNKDIAVIRIDFNYEVEKFRFYCFIIYDE